MIQQVRYYCRLQRNSYAKERRKENNFLTRYELFEYVVIFFDFYNVFETFQTFINVTLKKYLNDFCFEYLDDILIYNETRDDHV